MKKPSGHLLVGPIIELPPGHWPVKATGVLRSFLHYSGLHAEHRRRVAGPFDEFRILTMRAPFPRRDRGRVW